MPRAGLSAERVVAEAESVVDEIGLERLTLAAVAERLGVRLPSLYKHLAGMDALQRGLTARAKEELSAVLARATAGLAGPDAVRALAAGYRQWAHRHPGRYALTVRAPRPDDAADVRVSAEWLELMAAVLAGFGVPPTDTVDAIRAVRAALHGFVDLELRGGFGMPDDVDASFAALVEAMIRELTGPGRRG